MYDFFTTLLGGLFVLSVIFIWFMIAYQLVLTTAGFFHNWNSAREKKTIENMTHFENPRVCILIPAHNEETVIQRTLEAMVKLDYPHDKLEILVINDGSSDKTGEIVENVSKLDRRVRCYNVPKGEGGRGKSRALNLGLKQTDAEVIAVYDADNQPLPDALKYLVAELLLHPDLGSVLGNFRTINKDRTWLTRFVSIETMSFQAILQAGRWALFKVATLPGTNFVIWKHLLDDLHGWDEDAITEDSELSIRVYMKGYKIKYIPFAVTLEQEPETISVWAKQRTRWVRGNNYVVGKFFKEIPQFQNKFLAFEVLYLLLLYYIFLFAIGVSDLIFILSVTHLVAIPLPGPYTTVWILAVVLFIFEIILVLSYEGMDTFRNFLLVFLMYFTYCQFWIYVVGRAIYLDYIKREKRTWAKTVRFKLEDSAEDGPR
ncbi:MAG: glycosyltransferase family 2 protein [Bacteroidetes bacterium]|nr:glycosyltransferase family 2 protein [Bacteroidota bacterium]